MILLHKFDLLAFVCLGVFVVLSHMPEYVTGANAKIICPANSTLCEDLGGARCGRCVRSADVNTFCLDRIYQDLCGTAETFPCRSTANCFYSFWAMDLKNDCFDNSDEDPCYTNQTSADTNCSRKVEATPSTCSCRPGPLTNGSICSDEANPCDSSKCHPKAACRYDFNANRSSCVCSDGYTGSGKVCIAVDRQRLQDQVPGTCSRNPLEMDCGGGMCLAIGRMRDCIQDCPSGLDEACPFGFTSCDGCKCVPTQRADQMCYDRKDLSASLCPVNGTQKCRGTTGVCIFPEWIMDGANDCGDYTDEDACLNNVHNCSAEATCHANSRNSTYSCKCKSTYNGDGFRCQSDACFNNLHNCSVNATCISQPQNGTFTCQCNPKYTGDGYNCQLVSEYCAATKQFTCHSQEGCVHSDKVLDGKNDCSDSSDENYCGSAFIDCTGSDPCAYNPAILLFKCGCPAGMKRNEKLRCVDNSAIIDCAGIQERGKTNQSWPYHFVERPNCQAANDQDVSCRRSLFCDFETLGGGWTVIQNRTDPNFDFFKSWHEYKVGFGGSTSGGYWLGNEALHEILSTASDPYELLIWLVTEENADIFAQYDSFLLENETNNYTLRLGELTFGNTDKLAHSRNRSFGTFDRDTDDRPAVHCGSFWRSGWWFDSNCGDTGNLNIPSEVVGSGHEHLIGVMWPVDGVDRKVQSTLMMVRPKQSSVLVSDCAEVAALKFRNPGDYHVVESRTCSNDNAECIRRVRCDFDTLSGGWTYIQKRTSGKEIDEDFWQDWESYKRGFGDLSGDYWAGNEFIHQLTNAQQYQLMVTLVPEKGAPVAVVHDTFRLDSEDQQYRLHIGAINSDLSNTSSYLAESDGRPFETWDKDTDDSSLVVCARWWQSGWWFQADCGSAGNLNAPFVATQFGNPQINGITWKDASDTKLFIKDVSMKIRPKG